MKLRHWIALGFLFALPLGIALAQSSVQLRPGDQGPIVFDTSGNTLIPFHIVYNSAVPTVSSCGGVDAAIVGSDMGGIVTVGSTLSTTCTITFAKAWGVAPACVVSWSAGPLAAMSYTISTTAISVTQTSTASNRLNYVCAGKQ